MSYGLQAFDASGALMWDSSTVNGGVSIDYQEVASAATGTFTYPALAGRTPFITTIFDAPTGSIVVDTALGYPRVTVSAVSFLRRFIVWVK